MPVSDQASLPQVTVGLVAAPNGESNFNFLLTIIYEICRKLVLKHFFMSTRTIKPTESELEILQGLWDRNLASVREVHEELSKTKES